MNIAVGGYYFTNNGKVAHITEEITNPNYIYTFKSDVHYEHFPNNAIWYSKDGRPNTSIGDSKINLKITHKVDSTEYPEYFL